MDSRWYNILLFLGSIFFLFFLFENKINKGIKVSQEIIDAPLAPPPTKDIVKEITGKEVNKDNLLERKIAGIVASFAETPQGKDFLRGLIQPVNPINELENNFLDVELPKSIIEYKIIEIGSVKTSKCGDKLDIIDLDNNSSKVITLGLNEFHNLDPIIGLMSIGETREISLMSKKFKIKLNKIIHEVKREKSLHFFMNKPTNRIACGRKVVIDTALKDFNNEKIYHYSEVNKKPLIINVNNKDLPTFILDPLIAGGIGNKVSIILDNKKLSEAKKYFNFLSNITLKNSEVFSLEIVSLAYME
ncbi:MAG: hypothetical protein J0H68_05090 [Sphingobacteriia bacterium]|nr:hypothetical protein [Sphingobacteriia bacterium]